MSGLNTSTRYNLEKDAAWSFGASDHVSCKFFVEHGPKKCYLPNWKNSQFHWKSPAEEHIPNSQDKDQDKDKKLTGSLKSSSQVSPFGLPTSPCQVEKVIFEKAIGAYMISEIWFNAEPKTYNNSFFYYNYVHFYFLFMILMGAYIKPVDVWGRRRTTTGPRISFLGGKSFLEKLLRAGEGMLRYVVWCLWGLGLCFLFDICGSMRSCSLFCKWGDSPRW